MGRRQRLTSRLTGSRFAFGIHRGAQSRTQRQQQQQKPNILVIMADESATGTSAPTTAA